LFAGVLSRNVGVTKRREDERKHKKKKKKEGGEVSVETTRHDNWGVMHARCRGQERRTETKRERERERTLDLPDSIFRQEREFLVEKGHGEATGTHKRPGGRQREEKSGGIE